MNAFFFFDPLYLVVMGPLMLLAIWASSRVKGTFAKYNKVPIRSGYSGADTARAILVGAGIHDVGIEAVRGLLSDHYDPRSRTVRLSEEVLNGRTPAAVAVAAHECGHALQHAAAYKPMEVRAAIVPAAGIGSSLGIIMVIAGLFISPAIAWVGVALFSFAVLFHFVTLPVEFDASNRAIKILERSGIVAADEMPGVRKTLYAAGFTYVAGALIALAELGYWIMHVVAASDNA